MNLNILTQTKGPILITGETGTGKSHFARLIHDKSPGAKTRKFLTFHIGSVSDNLFESELFGHIRGAFTGAIEQRRGYCEEVEQGTLFLDEIGELSPEAQKKFLFLLEERKFCPIGSCHEKTFNGRIIAATNKNLEKMLEKGLFREDLYWRLMVFSHRIPPLRETPEKLEELILYYFQKNSVILNKPSLSLSTEVMNFLKNHSWPGNIRELKNCLEYALCAAPNGQNELKSKDLPPWIFQKRLTPPTEKQNCWVQNPPLDYRLALNLFEKEFLHYALVSYSGKLNETARNLKLSKSTLIGKMQKLGINLWEIKARIKEEQNNIMRIA